MTKPIRTVLQFVRGQPSWRWLVAALALVLLAALVWRRASPAAQDAATFTVRRGNLEITVLEGGSVEALEAQVIRSEVKGMQGTKILKIIEEGYQVTPQDVAEGKVLVELDSSELKDRILTQEIQFQSTLASRIEAQQAYEIQINQNRTDINAAEQKARFALMDFEKFLGENLARQLVDQLGLQEEGLTYSASQPPPPQTSPTLPDHPEPTLTASSASPPPLLPPPDNTIAPPTSTETPGPVTAYPRVDFSQYAKVDQLADGSAKQQLRKLEDDLLVSKSELGLAQTKLEWTQRLFDKGFVTKTELDNDSMTLDKTTLKVKTSGTELDLFIKYEFPKQAEELLSKYEEGLSSLVRVRKEAVSKLAQADAKLKAAEGRFKIESAQREELQDQLKKCVIRAERPGLVVYGGGRDERFFGGDDQIREGATVRERQRIITIPDMTQMAVQVKIHESHIKKIKKSQPARIRVEAFPEEKVVGEVTKVGVLPDSQNRWLNPDLKVYLTTIGIKGTREWLKPGMSAKVEILVTQLVDVVYVPIQAVSSSEGKNICYTVNGAQSQERIVQVGEFNDEFIEVKEGLRQGDLVLLRAPETGWEEPAGPETDIEKTEPPAQPTPAQAAPPAPRPAAAARSG